MFKPNTRNKWLALRRRQKEKDFAELAEAMERDADPFEQAKLHLRRQRFVVFPESDGDGWVVGGSRHLTALALVIFAERLGWLHKPKERRWREKLTRNDRPKKR